MILLVVIVALLVFLAFMLSGVFAPAGIIILIGAIAAIMLIRRGKRRHPAGPF